MSKNDAAQTNPAAHSEDEPKATRASRLSLTIFRHKEAKAWKKIPPKRKKAGVTPRARLRARRACWVSFWIFLIACVLVGLILLIVASADLNKYTGASQAQCKVYEYVSEPMQDWREACSACSFWVQGVSDSFGLFTVKGWKIEFGSSYRSQSTSVAVHDEFKCCPTEPDVDCCRFYHPESMLFCDNWGPIDASCREGTWTCFVYDLEAKLASEAGVTAADLYVGDPLASMPMLIAGVTLLSLGTLFILFLLLPCRKVKQQCRACGRLCGNQFSDNQKAKLALKVPERYRSDEMWSLIVSYKAAVFIQRYARKWLHRRKMERQAEAEKERAKASVDFFSEHMRDLRACSLGEKQERPLIAPPPPTAKSHRILYDTGNVDTFCRLVRFRVASSPKDELQRVEMAVMEDGEAKQLSNLLKVPNDLDARPIVTGHMRGTAFELSGISQGWRLLKAGHLLWPHCTGHQLLAAIREASRPLFLVFEGRPTDLNMPLFFDRVDPGKLRALSRPTPPKSGCSPMTARDRAPKPLPPDCDPAFVRHRPTPSSQRSDGSSPGPISHRSRNGSGEVLRAEILQPAAMAHLLQPLALPAPLELPEAGLRAPEPPPSPPHAPAPWDDEERPRPRLRPASAASSRPASAASSRPASAASARPASASGWRGTARSPSSGRSHSGSPKSARVVGSDSMFSGHTGSRQRRRTFSGLRRSSEQAVGRRARSASSLRSSSLSFPRSSPHQSSAARPTTAYMAPDTPPRRPYSAGRAPQPPRGGPSAMGPMGRMEHDVLLS